MECGTARDVINGHDAEFKCSQLLLTRVLDLWLPLGGDKVLQSAQDLADCSVNGIMLLAPKKVSAAISFAAVNVQFLFKQTAFHLHLTLLEPQLFSTKKQP